MKTGKKQKPVCPIGNHTDEIIPIVYGEPTNKTMEKAQKGLARLGGCVISKGDPKYYCIRHKVEF